ncbi:MAG: bifunctional glutamate N-acetyltransferase/amino-acid acetyltransferase ArgJ [Eggerthellaceae bacterium]|jgi:glutamate N-acetyltransferase/amino-acid N-acetyltransferase
MATSSDVSCPSTNAVQPLNLREQMDSSTPEFEQVDGGVTAALGFKAAGVHAGFRRNPERLDMALVVADEPVATAGVFTKNVFCSAPVIVDREQLGGVSYGTMRAVVINSGIANAATGSIGLENAYKTTELVSEVVGCPKEEVLVASTGVIGQHLNLKPFDTGLPEAFLKLSRKGGHDAAVAIMTTDTHPKEAAVRFSGDDIGYPGASFTVGGMAKGSGMIMPNMATMISVISTDAPVAPDLLYQALKRAADMSFNKVTVDSDTSTNDTCILMASGQAAPGQDMFEPGTAAFARFEAALQSVCISIARMMAADGEGASRLITIRLVGARNDEDADKAARAVANSPLLKCAVFGHDANWGRVAAALGKSGAQFNQEDVAIDIMGLPVCRDGLTVEYDEDKALELFELPEIEIDIDLGAGDAQTTMWTCDFTHEYVSINGDYRS